jgi:hypothetical protein
MPEKSGDSMKPLLLAGWLLAYSGDMATTDYAMNHQGAKEWTLPTQNRVMLQGILAGEAAFGYWMYKRWHVTNPKLAKVLYVIGVSSHGAATVWNVTQIVR